jgi:hypothetical protein
MRDDTRRRHAHTCAAIRAGMLAFAAPTLATRLWLTPFDLAEGLLASSLKSRLPAGFAGDPRAIREGTERMV